MTRIVIAPFLLAVPQKRFGAQVLLPGIIFVRRGVTLTPVFIAHELVHVHQIRRYGLIGYWVRYLYHLIHLGYQRHPFEIEAHERAGEFVEQARALIDAL